MKKILILILLLCFGSKAYAQLPELGWSKEQVEKFMEEKYKYNIVDTNYDVESQTITYRFAPVSLYGIDGILSIFYGHDNKVAVIRWYRGQKLYEPLRSSLDKKTLEHLDSNLARSQVTELVNSISRVYGKATAQNGTSRSFTDATPRPYTLFTWFAKKQSYTLFEDYDKTVTFSYENFKDN